MEPWNIESDDMNERTSSLILSVINMSCNLVPGYDLSSEEGYNKMMTEFDDIIGFEYLKALHINDSKG